jgi:hypothetical protein
VSISKDPGVRKTLVGRHRPDESSREPGDHALGFGIALQNALDGAKERLFPGETLEEGGVTFDVTVRFEATVNVRNPGAIDEYRALVGTP